jgi:hypothetical protein
LRVGVGGTRLEHILRVNFAGAKYNKNRQE